MEDIQKNDASIKLEARNNYLLYIELKIKYLLQKSEWIMSIRNFIYFLNF